MPVALRIIPCLDVDAGHAVEGVNFGNLRDTGGPVEPTSRYGTKGAGGITFLDVSVSSQGHATTPDVVAKAAEEVFMPFAVGGGVHSVEDVARLLAHGVDKVGTSTATIVDLDLISRVANRFDDQVLALSVDARRHPRDVITASGFKAMTHGGKRSTGIDALGWTLKAAFLGAGGILLNPVDADKMRTSFDPETLNVFHSEVTIPLIASRGAGTSKRFLETVRTDADVLLAAPVFYFGEVTISDVKSALHTQGFEIHI